MCGHINCVFSYQLQCNNLPYNMECRYYETMVSESMDQGPILKKIQCRFALLSFYSILIGWLKFPANQRSVNLSWNYLYENGPTWPLSLHIALFEHLNHHRRRSSSRPHFRLSQLHVASRPLSKLKIYCVKSIRQKSSNLALPISLLLRSRNSSSSDIRRGLVKNLQV